MYRNTTSILVALTITDENGQEQTIEATESHPFWVVTDEPDLSRAARSVVDENGLVIYHENLEPGSNGFWVEAKDLQPGDVFLGANGELSMLYDIAILEYCDGVAVYNLGIQGNNNYFVIAANVDDGTTAILTHNMCAAINTADNLPPQSDVVAFMKKHKLNGAWNSPTNLRLYNLTVYRFFRSQHFVV